jgi:hypothetical protein
MRSITACLSALVLLPGESLGGYVGAQDHSDETVEFLWIGMKAHRQLLQSGIFRVQGRKIDDSPAEAARIERDVEVFCAFVYADDLLRFDRREPIRESRPSVEEMEAAAGAKLTRQQLLWYGGKYARSRDKSAHFIEGTNDAVTRPRDHPPVARVMAFDVRALGLYYWYNLEAGTLFDEICNIYRSQKVSEVVIERPGVHRLRWRLSSEQRRTLWIDEQRGYTPVHLEVVDRLESNRSREWDDPTIVSDVTWVETSGVWVPKTYRIEEKLPSGRFTSYEFVFEWESVNEPVLEQLFTVEGFNLPKGTYLIDSRLGQPIVTGAVGRNSVPEFGILRSHHEPPRNKAKPTVVVSVGVTVVLAVLGFLLYRRLRVTRG